MSDRHIISSSLSARVIEHLRKKHTQVEIARMLGVSEGFISLIKNRERSLTIDHLELLAEAMSVPLGAMLMAITESKKPSKDSRQLSVLSARIMEKADKTHEATLSGATVST